MAPSSSGPGHQVLILKIAGSNPAGVTIQTEHRLVVCFYVSFVSIRALGSSSHLET